LDELSDRPDITCELPAGEPGGRLRAQRAVPLEVELIERLLEPHHVELFVRLRSRERALEVPARRIRLEDVHAPALVRIAGDLQTVADCVANNANLFDVFSERVVTGAKLDRRESGFDGCPGIVGATLRLAHFAEGCVCRDAVA